MRVNRFTAVILSLVMLTGIVPTGVFGFAETVSPPNELADGTVIYYEDFEYSDNSDSDLVISSLGWTLSEDYLKNEVAYSISGGKLLCDTVSTGAASDSYVTILDDAAMSEAVRGDYTLTYKLKYIEATNYKRYNCLLYNYNGYKSYNSVHLRVAGYGNNQVRNAADWYHYEDTSSGYCMRDTGTDSVSYKLFKEAAVSANASTTTDYPLVNKEVTVRIAVDLDVGPTVYANGVKVSVPVEKYAELFQSARQYANAVALKSSVGVKAYIDDIMIYTGLGDIPSGVTKESVTYKRPEKEDIDDLKVMSFNVLYSDQTVDALGDGIQRSKHMYNIVSGVRPDIVGFQERTKANIAVLTDILAADSGYAIVDNYRTDTSVANVLTCVPIMYNTARFSLVANASSNGNYAHGALLYDKSYNIKDMTASQIASYSGTKGLAWAVLKDKQTGGYVLAMNTHFAINSSTYTGYSEEEAIEARLSNAAQAINVMKKVYSSFGTIPTVFTGDFNMRISDPSYKLLSTVFSDSLYGDPDFIKFEHSMNSITSTAFTRQPTLPIDHIFYNSEALTPIDYYVCNRCNEMRIASDHLAVVTVFRIEETQAPDCSHRTGIYSGTQSVTLTGSGDIYYTTDNTDPRTSHTRKRYGGKITVSKDTVIKYCSEQNGLYSPVERVTLFYGTPIYITEAIKNTPGSDFYEGIELVNVSSVPVDLKDFYLWGYSDKDETACKNVAASNVLTQMKMAYCEGDSVIPAGAVAFCPIAYSGTYLSKEAYSATESGYLVTLSEDATKVTYHKDRWAKAISYDGSGNISEDLIFPIDRTSRAIGYTDSGVAVRRADYYHATDGSMCNTSNSFNLANNSYANLYITLYDAQSVSESICTVNLDSTGGGTVTNSDATVSVSEGSYVFMPTGSAKMKTEAFNSESYSIGYLSEAQKTAFDKIAAARYELGSKAITTAAEFAAMTASGSYYLANDITLSATYTAKFTGVLDGRGHTVTTAVPMFADMSGYVKDLTVEGDISVNGTLNGAVAAEATGDAVFENVTVNATLSGGTTTGGLIGLGSQPGSITAINCVNNGNHSGSSQTGGLVGYCKGVTLYMEDCVNNGDISSTSYSAGIVCRFGRNASPTGYTCHIIGCVNNGDITSTQTRSAGILAYSVGRITITGCINNGNIGYTGAPANFVAGGIYGAASSTYTSGDTTVNANNALTVTDCCNYGKVSATAVAGGIVGRTSGVEPITDYVNTISDCGNFGEVTVIGANSTFASLGASGIVGYFYGAKGCKILRCFNVGDVSVNNSGDGIVHRAAGIAAYFNGSALEVKHCYNAGAVTAEGSNAEAYQLYFNNSAAGAAATYITNNYALAVDGAKYALNGTQSDSFKTFDALWLANGELRDAINGGAGETCYYQLVGAEEYPVVRIRAREQRGGIIIADGSEYKENGKHIYKVEADTDIGSFKAQFDSDILVYNGDDIAAKAETVSTGLKVTSYDGTESMLVAVKGDIDGDGAVTVTDYTKLKSYFKGLGELTELQQTAANTNCNDIISVTDYIIIKRMISGNGA